MTPNETESGSGTEAASVYVPDSSISNRARPPRIQPSSDRAYTFHPRKPHTILVGTSGTGGSDVWLSVTERLDRPGGYRCTFYDHQSVERSEDQLKIDWVEEFR